MGSIRQKVAQCPRGGWGSPQEIELHEGSIDRPIPLLLPSYKEAKETFKMFKNA